MAEAGSIYREILAIDPDHADSLHLLGLIAADAGRVAEALELIRRALTVQPDFPVYHNSLGTVLEKSERLEQAAGAYRAALRLNPRYPEAHSNLGNIFQAHGGFAQAIECYGAALRHDPDHPLAHFNLGNLFKAEGRLDEAVAHYRRAVELLPHHAAIHSNLLLALHYQETCSTADLAAEHHRWFERHAARLKPVAQFHSNLRDPDRRLRIGYVSRDFCDHPVGRNLLPLFAQHAPDEFEIFAYSQVPEPDALTAAFRARSSQWREIASLSDPQLADRVRQDQIDILVDLGLHTAHHRLLAFARKPAPVQVSFAGYPAGTGLETIDYHLTDPFLDPPGAGPIDVPDAPFRLPETFWCYDPRGSGHDVNALPALASGRVTFGALNNFCKVGETVLRLWARVLRAVPASRLLLLAPESTRPRIVALLAETGVSADRITFTGHRPRAEYLALYRTIDLGLDTLPYNGHTTSLDSYWMGVPVVTLVGRTSVGRAGWSQLSNLGLTEFAAHSPDEFVRLAAQHAGSLPALAALRAGLRERMRRSPLMDAPRFARAVEAAYRTMWRKWCAHSARSGERS